MSTAIQLLNSPTTAQRLAQAAGRALDHRRLASLAITAITKTPYLQNCEPESVVTALLDCARLGLEPDGVQAALIPYVTKGRTICQAQPMYQGLINLMYRDPNLQSVSAHVVREGDQFSVRLGTDPHIDHIPVTTGKPRPPVCFYFVAHIRGRAIIKVMTREEIEAIRDLSPTYKRTRAGPWVDHFVEMGLKTMLKSGGKVLPKNSELTRAFEYDDTIDSAYTPREIPPPSTELKLTIKEVTNLFDAHGIQERDHRRQLARDALGHEPTSLADWQALAAHLKELPAENPSTVPAEEEPQQQEAGE